MEIPQYTGLNIGKALTRPSPEGVVSTLERTAQREEQQERWETERKQEREDQYLGEFAVKPVYLISKKAREKQAEALEKYNNKYAPLLQSGRDLTLGERTQMAQDRMVLEGYQQDMLAKIGEWKRIDDIMQQDKRNPIQKFDHEEWADITKDFDDNIDTKEFNFTPPIKAQSFDLALERNTISGTPQQTIETIKVPGSNIPEQVTVTASATEDEAKQHIENLLFDNEAWRKDVISKFKDLSVETKLKYLDTNKNNKIDPSEEIEQKSLSNPIIQWAKDNYWKKAVKTTKSTPKGMPQPPATGKSTDGKVPAKVSGVTVALSPGERVRIPTKYGKETYSKYSFLFGDKTIHYSIPTQNAKTIAGTWEGKTDIGSVNARIVLYDPIKRVFVIEPRSSESADVKSTVLLEIPEIDMMGFENVPVQVGGKTIRIGDSRALLAAEYDEELAKNPIQGSVATPAKEQKKDWSKYKR